MSINTHIAVDATLTQLLEGGTLASALARVAERIRKEPQSVSQRMVYFDLLCLTGAWEKALPVLQTALNQHSAQDKTPHAAEHNAALIPVAYVCRQLVQAELFRASVFAGQHQPAFTLKMASEEAAAPAHTPEAERISPPWLRTLWEALCAHNANDSATADVLRRAALNQAPESAGEAVCVTSNTNADRHKGGATGAQETRHNFLWLGDSDSRLGPVLEVFVGGRYVWLPFCHVRRLDVQGPRCLRDLLWLPATLALVTDGPEEAHACFVPGRYVGSAQAGDALALGRETHWEDVGETGVVARGQKTLICDKGDLPLYDLRRLTLESAQ